ncbi:SGNH/GDSL hydrolase family protein [Planctomicrobium sp. SH664]|uniref:SGNH/GDSL hydrolase family protein n=1 Tax=Planctomicrobium sp. SH664 TaxID=3448125 RepID=UPI003F5B1F41
MQNLTRFLFSLVACSLLAVSPVFAEKGTTQEAKPVSKFEATTKKLAEKPLPPPGGIVFIGSSSIRLWDVEKWFPGLNVTNNGFGGSVLADSVEFFDRLVVPLKPKIIVLYAGDNDISRQRTPYEVYQDFRAFVAKAHQALPEARIIYIGIKPSNKRWNLVHRVRAANALIAMDCVEDPLLTFVDVDAPMMNGQPTPPTDLFVADGLHLSEKGYALWTDLLLPHLTESAKTKAE